MENTKIRLAARGAGVPLWRIAQEMGVSEPTITRRLRTKLPIDEEKKILNIIRRIKEGAAS